MKTMIILTTGAIFALLVAATTPADDQKGLERLMTQGKLGADLGEYEKASEAFRAIADDGNATATLRWEALVRLGLVLTAAGDVREGAEAFREVRTTYSDDPRAMRFLRRAVITVSGKSWVDFEPEFETLLESAAVVSIEEMGAGLDKPKKVRLEEDGTELDAISKTAERPGKNSYRGEIAAYRLDRLLGLGMVPPTVPRSLEGREGAFQLWVLGCRFFPQVEHEQPATTEWNREISRMLTFDSLIGNRTRNRKNFLVDSAWHIVLIDHTMSFSDSSLDLGDLPDRFDRALVAHLRKLERASLQERLGSQLSEVQIRGLLARRDAILSLIDELVQVNGEAEVFF